MPTPRYHGGAPLIHFPLTVPGFKGLNTQDTGAILGPEWATKLDNAIIDSNDRVAARKGAQDVTTTAHSSRIVSGIEYAMQDGSTQLVGTTAAEVVRSTNNGDSWSDVTGTASFTDGNWHLVNFNDFVIGFQLGEKALIYNGTAASQIADANAPTGGVGTAAFGRIWQFDADGVTLEYSALLDHTNWTTGGAGLIDLSSIWLDNDTAVAITAYNNLLVVFGTRNILVFTDPTGTELGIDPTNMIVLDTIPGIGCHSQSTVQHVGGDIWFISNSMELMSLSRVIVEQKAGNLNRLSKNISNYLATSIRAADSTRIRSAYSPTERFYLLSLPAESTPGANDETGEVFVFDTRGFMEDASARVMGVWNQLVPTCFFVRKNGDLLFCLQPVVGQVFKYNTYTDNSSTYDFIYESGWLDLGQYIQQGGIVTILKRIQGLFHFTVQTEVIIKWAFDFSSVFKTRPILFANSSNIGEWGLSEWNVGEWGGGVTLGEKKVAGGGMGEYIKIGTEATINGGEFAIQKLEIMAKLGRAA